MVLKVNHRMLYLRHRSVDMTMHEMLQVARECSTRERKDAADVPQMSFGEFCLFCRELKSRYQNQSSSKSASSPALSSESVSRPMFDRPAFNHRVPKNISKIPLASSSAQYQVFLGGSCNPTTWRHDVAIPMLNRHGISYYNPQVSHWEEALLETECEAKRTAAVLFFVLDSATRNVASMVEATFMAAGGRKLVLVMHTYRGAGQKINGESISQAEYEELSGGLMVVQDLVERQGIPVFSQVNHALTCTAKILRENIWPQQLELADKVQPIKYPHLQLGEKIIKLRAAFSDAGESGLTLAEAQAAFKAVAERDLSQHEMAAVVAAKKGIHVADLDYADLSASSDIRVSFQELCGVVAEFEQQQQPADVESNRSLWDLLSHAVTSPINRIVDLATLHSPRSAASLVDNCNSSCISVYIVGGSSTSTAAAVSLRKAGVVSVHVGGTNVSAAETWLSPSEASRMEAAKVLLFTVGADCRGVAQMAMAAYYIGLGCNVVLCVQMLSQGTIVNGEELSSAAVKDYNRGRSYLTDQARKESVPVTSEVDEAVQITLQKCKAR